MQMMKLVGVPMKAMLIACAAALALASPALADGGKDFDQILPGGGADLVQAAKKAGKRAGRTKAVPPALPASGNCNEKTTNDDGTITVTEPRFRVGGDYLPFFEGRSDDDVDGICRHYGLGGLVTSTVRCDERSPKAVMTDKHGKLTGFQYPRRHVLESDRVCVMVVAELICNAFGQ